MTVIITVIYRYLGLAMQLMLYPVWAVAYLGFHFRGGSKYFGKVGVFAWRFAPCSAWQSHAFARGVRGHMLTRQNFKKWCNLVSFGEYFAKIL